MGEWSKGSSVTIAAVSVVVLIFAGAMVWKMPEEIKKLSSTQAVLTERLGALTDQNKEQSISLKNLSNNQAVLTERLGALANQNIEQSISLKNLNNKMDVITESGVRMSVSMDYLKDSIKDLVDQVTYENNY